MENVRIKRLFEVCFPSNYLVSTLSGYFAQIVIAVMFNYDQKV